MLALDRVGLIASPRVRCRVRRLKVGVGQISPTSAQAQRCASAPLMRRDGEADHASPPLAEGIDEGAEEARRLPDRDRVTRSPQEAHAVAKGPSINQRE